jgi:hypothetical protein
MSATLRDAIATDVAQLVQSLRVHEMIHRNLVTALPGTGTGSL